MDVCIPPRQGTRRIKIRVLERPDRGPDLGRLFLSPDAASPSPQAGPPSRSVSHAQQELTWAQQVRTRTVQVDDDYIPAFKLASVGTGSGCRCGGLGYLGSDTDGPVASTVVLNVVRNSSASTALRPKRAAASACVMEGAPSAWRVEDGESA